MTTRAVMAKLSAMEHCTCRIDAHCLADLKRLGWALRTGALTRLQVLRALHAMQRCPCYFATHCIETLCELVEELSRALRRERSRRIALRTGAHISTVPGHATGA